MAQVWQLWSRVCDNNCLRNSRVTVDCKLLEQSLVYTDVLSGLTCRVPGVLGGTIGDVVETR